MKIGKEKVYVLNWFYCGKHTEVERGNKAFLQWKRTQLKKEPQYRMGKLTIISEAGLKYNEAYARPKTLIATNK